MAGSAHRPFRDRIALLNLLTVGAALLLAAGLLFVNEYTSLRSELGERMRMLGAVIADNSAAALVFADEQVARDTLHTLKSAPGVTRAALYTENGRLLAEYRAGNTAAFESTNMPRSETVRFRPDALELRRPVNVAGRDVGFLVIESNFNELNSRLLWHGWISIAVVLAALAASWALATRLRRRLTRTEEALSDLTQTLEQRVGERTRDLELANRDLESFSYSVSHDLRSPLRAINGYANILGADERGRLSPEGAGLFDRIVANAQRMNQLIDDILAYSRAGTEALDRRPLRLDALAAEIAAELRPAFPNAVMKIGEVPPVAGSEAMLRQVLENLLANAFKYSSHQPAPEIEFGAIPNLNGPEFFVRDNGAGFDMRYADKLFGVFSRLHTESEFPGTGVGLAIVKRLIDRHGGTLRAEGRPGRGAIFYFTVGRADR